MGVNSVAVPPATACKHGAYRCDKCGTSDRSDALHRTAGGKGEVGRLAGPAIPPDAWQAEVRKKERPGRRLRRAYRGKR